MLLLLLFLVPPQDGVRMFSVAQLYPNVFMLFWTTVNDAEVEMGYDCNRGIAICIFHTCSYCTHIHWEHTICTYTVAA